MPPHAWATGQHVPEAQTEPRSQQTPLQQALKGGQQVLPQGWLGWTQQMLPLIQVAGDVGLFTSQQVWPQQVDVELQQTPAQTTLAGGQQTPLLQIEPGGQQTVPDPVWQVAWPDGQHVPSGRQVSVG